MGFHIIAKVGWRGTRMGGVRTEKKAGFWLGGVDNERRSFREGGRIPENKRQRA